MAVAMAHTVALRGAVGHLIDVQADVSAGQVGLTLVGRADPAVSEGRDRVRMAIINSELDWPSTRRITVLLSPADLPKAGTHYDLALALAILAAADEVDPTALGEVAFIGELGLDGGLRSVTGVLPMVLAAAQRGIRAVVVPETQAREASMVPDMAVLGMRSLGQVVAELRGEMVPSAPPVPELSGSHILGWRGDDRLAEVDLADLDGMADARYGAEVAAAGGHHLLLQGPKGCGKTSLAERIPGLLPDLANDEAVELAAVRSLAGLLDPSEGLSRRPPFAAPHHDASKASVVGGGSGRVRPGQVSLAHAGVLFLDEFPLFRADLIEALREPMESGDITIARGDETITLPARSLLVLAANPCPCGNLGGGRGTPPCRCIGRVRQEYTRKITGPITDRIDIVRKLTPGHPFDADLWGPPESTAIVRSRVAAARERQAARYAGRAWRLNAQVSGPVLRAEWPLSRPAQKILDEAVYGGGLTRRGAVRVHRLSWTVADLAGVDRPGVAEVECALALRTGASLPVAILERWSA